jgi:hypothetical protein
MGLMCLLIQTLFNIKRDVMYGLFHKLVANKYCIQDELFQQRKTWTK